MKTVVGGLPIAPTTQPNQGQTALTKNSLSYNRTLFLEDNLPVLRGLDSESIDLIATDPPFNKGVSAFEGTTKAGENVEFKDVWHWGDVQAEWVAYIEEDHPSLHAVIQAANVAAGDDMGAFICWLAVRVLEMHRVLKPTGSIYLHIDHTAHAYVKAMMDAVFGRKQFRNEIVWAYTGPSNTKRWFPRKHDTILWYSMGDEWTFNRSAVLVPYDDKYVKRFAKQYTEKADKSSIFSGGHDTARNQELASQGKCPEDWWPDFSPVGRIASERTGYPTQKPLALYKRMIAASSNPGDMVLDPFAGCATTCVGAEQLGRQWIGIDIREESGDVIRERLEREVSESMAWNDIVRTPTEAPERTDGGENAAPELILVSPKRNAPRIPVREAREQLIVRDGQRCQGCGWEPEYADYLQVDHKKPRTLGGKNEMDNYALLCDPCNRKKSNKMTLAELRIARDSEGRMDADWYADEKWK